MKVYVLEHVWDYTDPDGNLDYRNKIIAVAPTKDLADKYVELYGKCELYDFEWGHPLTCHFIKVSEFDLDGFDFKKNPWAGDCFETRLAAMRAKYGEEYTTNEEAWYEDD